MEVSSILTNSYIIVQTKTAYARTVYSWKTNQYGLTADTVTAFELVLPCGVKTVTEQDEDLWFALKLCLGCGDQS